MRRAVMSSMEPDYTKGTEPFDPVLEFVELPCNCCAPAIETAEGYECSYCGAASYE